MFYGLNSSYTHQVPFPNLAYGCGKKNKRRRTILELWHLSLDLFYYYHITLIQIENIDGNVMSSLQSHNGVAVCLPLISKENMENDTTSLQSAAAHAE